MYLQEEETQAQNTSDGGDVAALAQPTKGKNRFFRPGVLVATILIFARVSFLLLRLFTEEPSAPPHQYVEGGFPDSGSLNQAAVYPSDIEAKPSAPVERGRIYLVQLGEKRMPYSLDDLAGWLRSSYSLDVQILPALQLEQAAYDFSREQYISQLLEEQIRRNLAALNADPSATIIGVTDADMYSIARNWESSFTQRDTTHRVAIISADCFSDRAVRWLKAKPGAYEGALENALQRILLRDVAMLYWHLPRNSNPESVLAPMLDVTLSGHVLYQSDLHPERTQGGMFISDPCLNFVYKRADPNAAPRLEPAAVDFLGECAQWEERSHDEQEERFQVRLAYGLLTVRHSDFYEPGAIPIEFERSTSDWWKDGSLAFGKSGSHNYDQHLWTQDDMRHIQVFGTAGGSEPLVRIPEWIPVLLFNRWVDQYGSGRMAELRWHPGPQEHFDLTRYTGEVESYLPCDDKTVCYLNGLRNARGDSLRFERDGDRNLTQLTGSDQHWLTLRYDQGKRISSIVDNRGRQVSYRYDERGYLREVSYPSGEKLEYSYDDKGYLVSFSAAPNATTGGQLLLRNEYDQGRLSRQTLADGKVFEYRYKAKAASEIASSASITMPDGTILDFSMSWKAGSTVRERFHP